MRGARLAGDTTKLIFSFRWIPEKDDNGQIYFALRYVVHPDVSIGFDVRPLTGDVGFLATWRALEETERRPALVLGTSNDDFTVGGVEENSQTLYGMLAKSLFNVGPVHVAPYAGAAWIFDLDDLRPFGGVNRGFQNVSTRFCASMAFSRSPPTPSASWSGSPVASYSSSSVVLLMPTL